MICWNRGNADVLIHQHVHVMCRLTTAHLLAGLVRAIHVRSSTSYRRHTGKQLGAPLRIENLSDVFS